MRKILLSLAVLVAFAAPSFATTFVGDPMAVAGEIDASWIGFNFSFGYGDPSSDPALIAVVGLANGDAPDPIAVVINGMTDPGLLAVFDAYLTDGSSDDVWWNVALVPADPMGDPSDLGPFLDSEHAFFNLPGAPAGTGLAGYVVDEVRLSLERVLTMPKPGEPKTIYAFEAHLEVDAHRSGPSVPEPGTLLLLGCGLFLLGVFAHRRARAGSPGQN